MESGHDDTRAGRRALGKPLLGSSRLNAPFFRIAPVTRLWRHTAGLLGSSLPGLCIVS